MLLRQTPVQAVYQIADGARGTRQTLRLMGKLARHGKTQPAIREKAAELVSHIPGQVFREEARELFYFVRDCIRYLQDVNGVETISAPEVTLQAGYGDCDDKAVLLAALLGSIGHPARFVAVGFSGPANYDHVYLETRIGAEWVPLESTLNVDMGWSVFDNETPHAVMRETV